VPGMETQPVLHVARRHQAWRLPYEKFTTPNYPNPQYPYSLKKNFPPLPKVDLLLYRATGPATPAAMALHDYLSRYLSGVEEIPVEQARTGGASLKLAPPPAGASPRGKIRPAA
ncbi:MAG: hypothetical protein ABI794_17325, partial [Betaproteobacteria bacterium]